MTYYVKQPVEQIELNPGDRIKFGENPGWWWQVRASIDGVTIVTRQAPFAPAGELTYSVIDWRAGVRGPANSIGQGWSVDTDEQCDQLANEIQSERHVVSQRNWLPIDVLKVSRR